MLDLTLALLIALVVALVILAPNIAVLILLDRLPPNDGEKP